MQTSKTDHATIDRNPPSAIPQKDAVRSTSSAYIAVDCAKHYLHYKHFNTAETEFIGRLLADTPIWLCFFKTVIVEFNQADVTPKF